MLHTYKAIVASTQHGNEWDASRVSYLYSPAAIEEIVAQLNVDCTYEKKTKVLEYAPTRGTQLNNVIGRVLNAVCVREHNQLKALAEIAIDGRFAKLIDPAKQCFFVIVGEIAGTDGFKSNVVVETEKGKIEVPYVFPPLKVIALYLSSGRGSSNPYLTIL